ncbi:MAG TPA: DMT family transporter [Thermoanaerobaculia bacterium]|nr:DMT family transporter [Thermoanaerobaculia bacterium]
MTRRWLAVLALFATAAAWGASFTLVKSLVAKMAPEPFIFWRFTLAGVILLIAARRHLTRALLLPGLVLGMFVFTGYLAQTHGLRFISAPRSAFLTGLYVVMVPFFQWRTTGAPRIHVWIASVLAVVGTSILIGAGFDAPPTFGDLLTLACAVIFAMHVVYSARWSTSESSAALAGVQVTFVGLAAAPLTFFTPPTPWDASLVAIILITAIITTAIAFAALMWAQAHVSATEAAVILAFEPVAAAFTAIAFEGEPLTPSFLTGAVLILAAMLLSQITPHPPRPPDGGWC